MTTTLSHRPAYRAPELRSTRTGYGPPPQRPAVTPASTLTATAARQRALKVADEVLGAMQQVDPALQGPLYCIFAPLRQQRMSAQYFPGAAATFEADARFRSKWFGRGHGIVLDEDLFQTDHEAAMAAGLPADRADVLARRSLTAKIIHEFAHALANGFDGSEGPLGAEEFDAAKVRAHIFDASAAKVQGLADHEASLPRFAKHDSRFLRAAIHLWLRMLPRMQGLPLTDVVHSEKYGLSPVGLYAAALGKELASKTPIRTLLARVFPADFRQLWRRDVMRWYSSLRDPTNEQTALAAKAIRLCP